MKVMADRLAGLGAPVNDKDLTYNIVCGLNPRLHHTIPHITLRRRPPSFLKTRSMLQLEEQRIAESEKMQAAAALVAQSTHAGTSAATPTATTPAILQAAAAFIAHAAPGTPAHPGAPGRPPAPPSAPPTSNTGGRSSTNAHGAKKKKKKGTPSAPAPPPGFWPSTNPWTGMVHAWPF
jgi:hypothetical protein